MRFLLSAPVAAVAALPLLATACSSTSPSTSKAAAAATSPATANPNAGLLTGTKLKTLLAPASWFPSGFTADPSGSVDTGDYYQPPTPAPGVMRCPRLDTTGWVQLAGVGAVSWAQNDYIDQNAGGQYAQEIDVYQGTSAQDAMAGLRKLAGTCPSFRDAQTSSTVSVRLRKGPHLGDDALAFTLTNPRWLGGSTLEAVRVGTAVITVLYSASSGTGQVQATRLASVLATNLTAKG
jgi:hypothetical protein